MQFVVNYPMLIPTKKHYFVFRYFPWFCTKNKFTLIFLISSSIVASGKLSHRPSVAIIIKSFSSTLNDVTDARSGLNKIKIKYFISYIYIFLPIGN